MIHSTAFRQCWCARCRGVINARYFDQLADHLGDIAATFLVYPPPTPQGIALALVTWASL